MSSNITNKLMELFPQTLIANDCMVYKACQDLNINPWTYYNWRKLYPDFALACDNAMYRLHDDLEGALIKAIRDGNVPAIIFYCKTKLKYRGYGEEPVKQILSFVTQHDENEPEQELSDQDKKLLENYVQDRIKEMNDEKLIEGKAE